MIHVKNYNNFINESLIPSYNVDIEELLSLLDEQIDVFRKFSVDNDQLYK